MFTRKFELVEVLPVTGGDSQATLFIVDRSEVKTIEKDKEYQADFRLRLYCLECGESQYQTHSFKSDKVIYHYRKEELLFESILNQEGFYVCPCCQHQHSKGQAKKLSCDAAFDRHQTSFSIGYLSDIDEMGLTLLTEMIPENKLNLNSENFSGYQLFRYQIFIFVDPETLEILPIERPWDRAYFCLNNGLEVSYSQSEEGGVKKIPKNLAFSNIYENSRPYISSEHLVITAKEGSTHLNRTGLRNYAESIQYKRHLRDFDKIAHIYSYERFRQDYPCIEQLAKCGYTELICGIIEEGRRPSAYDVYYAYSLLNKEGTNPSLILGYPKAVLKRLKQLKVFETVSDSNTFKDLHKQQALDLKFLESFDEQVTIGSIIAHSHLILDLNRMGYSYYELVEYAKRAWLGQVLSVRDTWQYLRDYVQMANLMEVEYERFPRYLKVTHDLMQRNFKYKEDEMIQKQFEQNVQRYQPLCYEPVNEDYFITIPTKTEDLVKEGHELSHCVASYIKQVSQGNTMILFLREKSNPSKPYITIEWKNNCVIQARGRSNASLELYPGAKKFLSKWINYTKQLPRIQHSA